MAYRSSYRFPLRDQAPAESKSEKSSGEADGWLPGSARWNALEDDLEVLGRDLDRRRRRARMNDIEFWLAHWEIVRQYRNLHDCRPPGWQRSGRYHDVAVTLLDITIRHETARKIDGLVSGMLWYALMRARRASK